MEWYKHIPYWICIVILILWGVRISPAVKNSVSQVTSLNKLQKVDVKCACGMLLENCSGSL